jgi:hypothetical protein
MKSEYSGPEGLAGWPVVAVEQLALEGGEEALGDALDNAVADGAYGGDQAGLLEAAAERQAGVPGRQP